jgi:rhamnosyltransferase
VHAYGIPTQRRFLYRTVQPSNYSPTRRYFNARNRLAVWRTYWRGEGRYVLFDIRAWTKELIKVLLFEDQRPQKFRAVLRGARDAIRGVTGPLPPHRIRS